MNIHNEYAYMHKHTARRDILSLFIGSVKTMNINSNSLRRTLYQQVRFLSNHFSACFVVVAVPAVVGIHSSIVFLFLILATTTKRLRHPICACSYGAFNILYCAMFGVTYSILNAKLSSYIFPFFLLPYILFFHIYFPTIFYITAHTVHSGRVLPVAQHCTRLQRGGQRHQPDDALQESSVLPGPAW